VDGRSAAASGSGDPDKHLFSGKLHRVSVLMQRFNAILISETSFDPDEASDQIFGSLYLRA